MYYFGGVVSASAPVTVGKLPVPVCSAKSDRNVEVRYIRLVGAAISNAAALNHSVSVSLYDKEADRFLVYPSPFVCVGADPQTGHSTELSFWLPNPYFLKRNSLVQMLLALGEDQGAASILVPDTGKATVVYPGFCLGGRAS